MNVGGFFAPLEQVAFFYFDVLPHIGAGEHVGIFFHEHLRPDAGLDRFADFLLGGPQILEIDFLMPSEPVPRARCSGQCPRCQRGHRRPPTEVTRGSSPSPADVRVLQSCGSRR
jgi:hypothetical protein